MKLYDAIVKILKEEAKPLHAKEITKKIIDSGLWQSTGQTPDLTVSAGLYSDIKKNGEESRFMKVGPQIFAFRDSIEASKVHKKIASLSINENQTSTPKSEGLSFTDCAQRVLEESGSKKAMHYKEITKQARAKGWLITGGKTPENSMYAQVITEIKRQQKRGERPRFVQHGRGYISLSEWMGRGLALQIEQHNLKVRKALHEHLLTLKPGEFEELIEQLLTVMGFEMVELTKLSGDGGIDVRGTFVVGGVVRIKVAIQAKRWKLKNNVQAPVVQQVRGSLGVHEQGLIITTSDFSAGATKEAAQADKSPIALMNGDQLVKLLMEHSIGVHRSMPDLFEIDEEITK